MDSLSQADSQQDPQGHRRGGGNTHQAFVPRFTKMDFPLYDGNQDPLESLNKADHFFTHQQTPPDEKVSIATYHLEGDAQLWSMKLKRDEPFIGWTDFKRRCTEYFGPPIPTSHYGELAKLKQTSTVAAFQRRFLQLLIRAPTLPPEQEVDLYAGGLKPHIAMDV